MRRAWALGGILLATMLAAVAVLAATAAASPQAVALLDRIERLDNRLGLLRPAPGPPGPLEGPRLTELRLTNHDGYRISVVAYGQTVALTVGNGPDEIRRIRGVNRASATTYVAHGRVTPNSIEASFGDRGRIAVRFRPSGHYLRATRRAGCDRPSRHVIARLGIFAGTLRFRGEDGYTTVRASRIRGGSIGVLALLRCRFGLPSQRSRYLSSLDAPEVGTNPSRRVKSTTLVARHATLLTRTGFRVRVRGEGRPRFLAVDQTVEDRLGIVRLVTVLGAPSSFEFEDTLARAVVSPPTPFSGRGVFEHGLGNEKAWTGSLAVSFLGAPRVPLAGAPYAIRLTQSW